MTWSLDLLGQSIDIAVACGFVWWQARMLLRGAKRTHEIGRDGDAGRWALESLRLAAAIEDQAAYAAGARSACGAGGGDGRARADRPAAGRTACGAGARRTVGVVADRVPAGASGWAFEDALKQGGLLSLPAAVEMALS